VSSAEFISCENLVEFDGSRAEAAHFVDGATAVARLTQAYEAALATA